MNRYKLFQWKAVIMLGVLMLSLMIATPAFADESLPPSGTEESTPETQTSGEEEPAPVKNSSEEETVEVQESAPPVETEASEQSPQEETVAEILEQLPQDTELIIVDENGEALPLASEAAEEAVVLKDPIWCPAGVAPKPNMGGCSGSFVSLSALVAGFIPPAKNGVIWIEAGTDSGAEVEIDGLVWTAAANYSLTLQGGWIGPAGPPVGSGAIIGTTTFGNAISIVNWNGAVTINDISFDGANNTFNSGKGSLYVQTTKNIVVTNVMSINSAGTGNDGAYLDNTSSTTQATVTVKNSTFNSNFLRGITIVSDGAVTLTNVSANSNTSYGVYIDNNNDTTASVVSVTKGFFNQNGLDGLHILSNGAVNLSQISASSNTSGGDGVDVNNTFAPTPQAVTVSGFLTANANAGYGLYIASDSAVTLTNIITDYNGAGGTSINNSTAPKPYAVTINGFNSMNGNVVSSNGLTINSLGVVTLNNITAESNGGYGVSVTNSNGTIPQTVNIKGVNFFNNNGNNGLFVSSKGAINVYNITANSNAYTSNSTGVFLDNMTDALKPQNINLFGTNTLTYNGEGGLLIFSYGAVTVNNITAYYNGFDSIDGQGSGVNIVNSAGTLARPVSLKGVNNFYGNDGNGLEISSLGAVSISNITASSNGVYGAYIDNRFSFQSPVTISGYGIFNTNTSTGLHVLSNGAITTTNLYAQSNYGSGAYLDTYGLTKIQTVTMKGNNTFIGNGNSGGESGLTVFADGNITVNNLTASQNYDRGAYLDNYSNWVNAPVPFTTFGSVMITGFGNFHNNSVSSGLYIWTQGNATMSYVTANQNGFDGVAIDAKGKVSLTCVLVTENSSYGFVIYTQPVTYITIKGLSAVGNGINESLAYLGGIRSRCTG
ncbi:MAG: hypothetical protein JNM46_01255 [Anaerolineales bacterium]|nr:hypothetical protein [Anaerolineales bacterium]